MRTATVRGGGLRRLWALAVGLAGAAVLAGCATDVSSTQLAEEYFNLGNAYFRLGEYQNSFEYYSRAIALSDRIPAAGYNLARLHERRGEYRESLAVLDSLLADDPDNGLYLETRAYVLYRAGEVTASRDLYARLLDEYPARVRLRYNLGRLELEAGEYERAYEVLLDGIDFADDDREYRWLTADAAHRAENEPAALRHLEVFRALAQDTPEELARLARRQAEWGYDLAAIETLDGIPGTVESDADLLFLQGSLYLRATGEFERGAGDIVAAVEAGFDPASSELEMLLQSLSPDERDIIQSRLAETGAGSDG